MKLVTFLFTIGDMTSSCLAVSVAQAIDRAKVGYLRQKLNLSVTSPKFMLEKSKLRYQPIRIELDPYYERKLVKLYREFKDGVTSQAEADDLHQLMTIVKDLKKLV